MKIAHATSFRPRSKRDHRERWIQKSWSSWLREFQMVSIITKQSAEKLGLSQAAKAYAIVKASSVMIGVD